MGTVTSMTAAAMQEVVDSLIVSAAIVGNALIFTREDGSTLNVGNIVGLGVSGLLEWPNTNLGEIVASPEGSAVAKPGSMRFRTNGEVWIKLTGTGNTGWAKVPTVAPSNMLEIVCTSGTRPSSPGIGQKIYETDTGKSLRYYGATTQWKPDWFDKWGAPLSSSVPNAVSTSGTTITLVSGGPTYTPEAPNRKLRLVIKGTYAQTGDGIFSSTLRLGSTGGAVIALNRLTSFSGAQSVYALEAFFDVATTTPVTPVWCLQRIAGSAGVLGVMSELPTEWSVEDWGPATGSTPPSV